MKFLRSIVLIFAIIVTPSPAFSADDTVEKIDCKLAIGYDSMDELKADLLLSAKRLAINELFGELITAATAVEDFVVTSDQIRASSLGLVREDTIRYYNGGNLGEVCIKITVYTTDEDRKQFVPIKLNKRNCVSNPDLTTRELRKFAEEEAIVKAVLEYNRKLEGQDRDKLLNLIQRVAYLESGMLPDTDTYCVRVEGYVTPIEAVALLQIGTPEEGAANSEAEFKNGEYRVRTIYQQRQFNSTWTLEISGHKIVGLSEWDCCPGSRTDPISGTIVGNKVVVQRDCSGQGGGACSQTFIGTLTGNIITGQFTGNTILGSGSWTLYLQE